MCGGENRRHHIDELHGRVVDTSRARVRRLDDQRNLQRLAIQKDAVLLLAVIEQPFAVIGDKDDERAIVELSLPEKIEEAADDRVRVRDVRVVRRRVRRVRFVKMEEVEERCVLV